MKSQGPCETTGTERFENTNCKCPTYMGNLGPCRTFEEGSNGRCVYCDHEIECHRELETDRRDDMYQLSEQDHDTQCYARAKSRGQRTFTVVEQDATAVKTIAHWIYLNIETAPAKKLHEALDSCVLMRTFAHKKNAD